MDFLPRSALPLLLATILFSAPAAAEEKTLFDFETTKLGDDWQAIRRITAAREALPSLPPAEAAPGKEKPPAGQGMRIETAGKAAMASLEKRLQVDWPKVERLTFWVYRSPEEAKEHPKSVVEVQFWEELGKAGYWRAVALDHEGWKRIEVPLKWTRTTGGRTPRWKEVGRIGFYFRDATKLWLDQIDVQTTDSPQSAEPTLDDLASAAFPGRQEAVRRLVEPHVALLTDHPALDLPLLAAHLKKAHDVAAGWAPLDEPRQDARPPTLIVFAEAEAYRKFVPRYADLLGAEALPPKADGFTFQGIATSSWLEKYGALRPVYTHEYIHALLEVRGRLPNRLEWLQEGMATAVQQRLHPQADFRRIVLAGAADASLRPPLGKLCDGSAIPGDRYWQAGTVVEMLATDPKYRERFSEFWRAAQSQATTDLNLLAPRVFQRTCDELSPDWEAFCRRVPP